MKLTKPKLLYHKLTRVRARRRLAYRPDVYMAAYNYKHIMQLIFSKKHFHYAQKLSKGIVQIRGIQKQSLAHLRFNIKTYKTPIYINEIMKDSLKLIPLFK